MTPKVSPEHLAARRDQILTAACACFARKGFHETTIHDIREESGLSTGAIYGHFESKDAIVEAAADRAWERLSAIVEETRSDASARAGLERLVGALLACAISPGDESLPAIRLEIRLWAAALEPGPLREIMRRWYAALVPEIAGLVARLWKEEGFDAPGPPEAVSRSIVAAVQGMLLQRAMQVHGGPVDARAVLDLLTP